MDFVAEEFGEEFFIKNYLVTVLRGSPPRLPEAEPTSDSGSLRGNKESLIPTAT